jgi:hypothetical protein
MYCTPRSMSDATTTNSNNDYYYGCWYYESRHGMSKNLRSRKKIAGNGLDRSLSIFVTKKKRFSFLFFFNLSLGCHFTVHFRELKSQEQKSHQAGNPFVLFVSLFLKSVPQEMKKKKKAL